VGVNPKLLDQVEGPYQVVDNDDHSLLLQMGDHLIRVSSDRITPAPTPRVPPSDDPHMGYKKETARGDSTLPPNEQPQDSEDTRLADASMEDDAEYVIDRIVGMRQESDGTHRYRVRWYGYSRGDDTWEPEGNLPSPMVQSYNRRVGLLRAN
jgi:hypothetical protein